MKNIIAYDFETRLIDSESPYPVPICVTACDGEGTDIYIGEEMESVTEAIFSDFDIVIAHNAQYDSIVAATHLGLMPKVGAAYCKHKVYDTIIAEKLLNIAEYGNTEYIGTEDGGMRAHYSLAALVLQYIGDDISEDKDSPDSWRTNYQLLEDKPLHLWPKKAVEYAKSDAMYTYMVYKAQQERAERLRTRFNGKNPLESVFIRTTWSFFLGLQTLVGCDVNPDFVASLEKWIEEPVNPQNYKDTLLKYGILTLDEPPRPDARGCKDHNSETCEYKAGKVKSAKYCSCPVKMTKGVKGGLKTKATVEFVLGLTEEIPELSTWMTDNSAFKFLEFIREEKANGNPITQYFNNPEEFEPEWLESLTKVKNEVTNEVKLEYGIQLDSEWLEQNSFLHPVLQDYAKYKNYRKLQSDYIPKYRDAVDRGNCIIRPNYNQPMKTGRTSCTAGTKDKETGLSPYPAFNGQQQDPEVRGAIVTPDGFAIRACDGKRVPDDTEAGQWAFVSLDYSAMELATYASTCKRLFGKSDMADLLEQGKDPHALLGARLSYEFDDKFRSLFDSVPSKDELYEVFVSLSGCDIPCVFPSSNKPEPTWGDYYKHYRTFAKPVGLGLPGMLGTKTIRALAASVYKIHITKEESERAKEVWLASGEENPKYLEYIKNDCIDNYVGMQYEEDEITGKTKKSYRYQYLSPLGMIRTNCTISAAANGLGLQAPGAEGALLGLEAVARCCWGLESNELLNPDSQGRMRCVPVLFIHDEQCCLVRIDEYFDTRVKEIAKIMEESMTTITGLPSKVEYVAMKQWDKFAKATYDEQGKLTVNHNFKLHVTQGE